MIRFYRLAASQSTFVRGLTRHTLWRITASIRPIKHAWSRVFSFLFVVSLLYTGVPFWRSDTLVFHFYVFSSYFKWFLVEAFYYDDGIKIIRDFFILITFSLSLFKMPINYDKYFTTLVAVPLHASKIPYATSSMTYQHKDFWSD